MRRRLGASLVLVALAGAVAVVALSSGAEPAGSDETIAPARSDAPAPSTRPRRPATPRPAPEPRRGVPDRRTPPPGAPMPPAPPPGTPGPEVPEMGCAYPADEPRPAPGCPPRLDRPQTPGAAPGRPWLIRE
jgi:hypothetical protein